jgi:hypothetical protein
MGAVADRVKNSNGADFIRENKTVKTLFDTSHFFELGDARKGFLSGAFGLPFERPKDDYGQREWERGSEVAAVLLVAELLAGLRWSGGSGRGGGSTRNSSPVPAGGPPMEVPAQGGATTAPIRPTTGGGGEPPKPAAGRQAGKKPADEGNRERGGRGRFGKDPDAIPDQTDSIKKRQQKTRKIPLGDEELPERRPVIEGTEKSEQREKNRLKGVDPEDFRGDDD